jgi:hypothetical protein
MMVAAKSEDFEIPPLYLDDFSNIDAEICIVGGRENGTDPTLVSK